MARFVEFTKAWTKSVVWINVDRIDGVQQDLADCRVTMICCSSSNNVWRVMETVAEVLAKLQDDPQPEPQTAKAGDDIAGWWVSEDRVIYVIGFRPDGRIAYLWDNGRCTTHDEITALAEWTRDPNRKGWD